MRSESCARWLAFHGAAGPWAVAGYRMGEAALRLLALERASRDLEVVHFAPPLIQYCCIVDGVAAATGASLGKLNLRLVAAEPLDTRALCRRRSTSGSVGSRPTAAFAQRFGSIPRDRRGEVEREVIALADGEVFEMIRSAESFVDFGGVSMADG